MVFTQYSSKVDIAKSKGREHQKKKKKNLGLGNYNEIVYNEIVSENTKSLLCKPSVLTPFFLSDLRRLKIFTLRVRKMPILPYSDVITVIDLVY